MNSINSQFKVRTCMVLMRSRDRGIKVMFRADPAWRAQRELKVPLHGNFSPGRANLAFLANEQ